MLAQSTPISCPAPVSHLSPLGPLIAPALAERQPHSHTTTAAHAMPSPRSIMPCHGPKAHVAPSDGPPHHSRQHTAHARATLSAAALSLVSSERGRPVRRPTAARLDRGARDPLERPKRPPPSLPCTASPNARPSASLVCTPPPPTKGPPTRGLPSRPSTHPPLAMRLAALSRARGCSRCGGGSSAQRRGRGWSSGGARRRVAAWASPQSQRRC